jgi:peptidoglycan/xylan/chitin deacetylase (PgdA/CDA1 family)
MQLIRPDDVVPSPHALERKTALNTLDVETDFGSRQCTALSRLEQVLDLMAELDIPLTAFIEGRLFESRCDICALLMARGVDIQLHYYDHGTFGDTPEPLRRSIEAYVEFLWQTSRGLPHA